MKVERLTSTSRKFPAQHAAPDKLIISSEGVVAMTFEKQGSIWLLAFPEDGGPAACQPAETFLVGSLWRYYHGSITLSND